MQPTVGRIVHYWDGPPEDGRGPADDFRLHAAIITHVWSDTVVDLVVFAKAWTPANAAQTLHAVPFSPAGKHRCWSWPAKVADPANGARI